jgi:hypothetical protein
MTRRDWVIYCYGRFWFVLRWFIRSLWWRRCSSGNLLRRLIRDHIENAGRLKFPSFSCSNGGSGLDD